MKLSRKKSSRNQIDPTQRKIISYFQTSSNSCETKEQLCLSSSSNSENKVKDDSKKVQKMEEVDCILEREMFDASNTVFNRTPTHSSSLLSPLENVISPSPECKVKPSNRLLISNKRKYLQSPTSSKPASEKLKIAQRCKKRIDDFESNVDEFEMKSKSSQNYNDIMGSISFCNNTSIFKQPVNSDLNIKYEASRTFSNDFILAEKSSEVSKMSIGDKLKFESKDCKISDDIILNTMHNNCELITLEVKTESTPATSEINVVSVLSFDQSVNNVDEPISNELLKLHVEDQITAKDGDEIVNSQGSDELFFEEIAKHKDILSEFTDENVALYQKNGRHRVVHVTRDYSSVILTLHSYGYQIERKCILKGFWCDTTINVDDIVNVLAEFNADQTAVIDNYSGLIIVHPDILISGTTVVAAVFCQRKAIYSEWFREVDDSGYSCVIGNIIHELFQQSIVDVDGLQSKQITREILDQNLSQIMSKGRNLLQMYRYKDKFKGDKASVECAEYLDRIVDWTNKYMKKSSIKNGGGSNEIEVLKIHDIEETLWSPRLGIKGKIDVTAEVKLHSRDKSKLILPLELKTGKASFSSEHRGQVMLYSMLTSEKRDNPQGGLLLYLKHSEMKEIKDDFKCQQGLIQMRNKIASSVAKPVIKTESGSPSYLLSELPPGVCSTRVCEKCPYLTTCAIYQRVNACHNKMTATLPSDNIFIQSLSHLNDNDVKYFELWCSCLFLESQSDNDKGMDTKSIWCNTGDLRCISILIAVAYLEGMSENDIYSIYNVEGDTDVKLNINNVYEQIIAIVKSHISFKKEKRGLAYTRLCLVDYTGRPEGIHRFTRRSGVHFEARSGSMSAMQYVLVSVEVPLEIAVGMGYIMEISSNYIEVKLDRDFYKQRNLSEISYRIDSTASKSSWNNCLGNVARLMANNDISNRLRNIIVSRQTPTFKPQLPKSLVIAVKPVLRQLNTGQQSAVFKALMCNDYLLIKGMPGAGKTATIVALVEVLVKLGRSVLLTSHTHSAVDNILGKLVDKNIDFLRLGNSSKVKDEITAYTLEKFLNNCQSVDDLDNFVKSKMVVATTCLGSNHAIFSRRNNFDYCIVDEASQILQATCLGPLFHCKKFILVGDPNQLPPIIRSAIVKSMNVVSLFDHLDCSGATVELNSQYRMNGEIVRLANILSYNGSLKAASDEVFNSVLRLNKIEDRLNGFDADKVPLLRTLSSPALENSVLFINTEAIQAVVSNDGSKKLINQIECLIAIFIVKFYIKVGLMENQIGVITPFRDQVNYLEHQLKSEVLNAIEVNTVDQYQGRDKDVIIVSCVRDEIHDNMEGSILNDKRRVNVAITRARTKLIIIGRKSVLLNYSPMKTILTNLYPSQESILETDCLDEIKKYVKIS